MKKLTEGRKPVTRSLPPLAEMCAGFKGFKGRGNRVEQVLEILTGVIQRCRRATPQAFYAMREAADFFGVSLTTMARVYRRLDREGVLTLVRSSHSIIAARTPRPRLAVRGVVCMPIWMPAFLYFLDWRKWFSELEEELSRYRFILEPIFYKAGEKVGAAFAERVLRFNPDYVLWNWPLETDKASMYSIIDAGVPILVIQNQVPPFPGRVYRTSYDRGMRQGLAAWAASGEIDNIVLPRDSHSSADSLALNVQLMQESCSLPYQLDICPPRGKGLLQDYLRQLAPNRRTGVIFDDDLFFARLCAIEPGAMYEFLRQHRVLMSRQVTIHLRMPKLPSDMIVDALVFPWKKLARQIALDLSKAKASIPSGQTILEAEWKPRVPLSTVAHSAFEE